jgi:hypothetical protein
MLARAPSKSQQECRKAPKKILVRERRRLLAAKVRWMLTSAFEGSASADVETRKRRRWCWRQVSLGEEMSLVPALSVLRLWLHAWIHSAQ